MQALFSPVHLATTVQVPIFIRSNVLKVLTELQLIWQQPVHVLHVQQARHALKLDSLHLTVSVTQDISAAEVPHRHVQTTQQVVTAQQVHTVLKALHRLKVAPQEHTIVSQG